MHAAIAKWLTLLKNRILCGAESFSSKIAKKDAQILVIYFCVRLYNTLKGDWWKNWPSARNNRKLTIRNFTTAFSYDFYRLTLKTPLPRKTMGFASQYAVYWPAICWGLQRKMHAFGL